MIISSTPLLGRLVEFRHLLARADLGDLVRGSILISCGPPSSSLSVGQFAAVVFEQSAWHRCHAVSSSSASVEIFVMSYGIGKFAASEPGEDRM